ncbi:MAG: nucleoside triphosphate pyrophosphohydrolase, partial [Pseudomonadales bacterium]
LLFCCVNLARHLGLDAEIALRGANNKFERRFRAIESALAEHGQRVGDCDAQTLDRLWEEAKTRCRQG